MALLYSSSSGYLGYWQRGGDMERAKYRLTFASAGTQGNVYKKGQWVRIEYNRARIREKIESVFIQIYPSKVEYRFNFIYNGKRITLVIPQDKLIEWNTEPPKPPTKPAKKPKRKKAAQPDRFLCEWGSCRLDKHPDIPVRWAARIQSGTGVIALPAKSPSTVMAAFYERIAALEIDDDETARMNEILMEARNGSQPAKISGLTRKQRPKAVKPRKGKKQAKKARILDYPQLRVRKYA